MNCRNPYPFIGETIPDKPLRIRRPVKPSPAQPPKHQKYNGWPSLEQYFPAALSKSPAESNIKGEGLPAVENNLTDGYKMRSFIFHWPYWHIASAISEPDPFEVLCVQPETYHGPLLPKVLAAAAQQERKHHQMPSMDDQGVQHK